MMGRIDELMRAVARESGGEVFHAGLVEGLPEPARRYLLHAIRPGARIAGSVRLRIKARMRLSPKARLMDADTTETIGRELGFVWKASVGRLLRISGFDRYSNGAGEMRWKLLGLIPVVTASGPDVTRSARGRFAAELVLLPDALLPQWGVAWTAEGSDGACATVEVGGERIDLHLKVGADGRLKKLEMLRWGDYGLPKGRWAHIPYAVAFSSEREFDGHTIPDRFTVAWEGASGHFDYFHGEVHSATYC